MNFWHSLLVALDNLRVNKLRSFLTMLGIIIGVFSVILMIAIVEGARANVVKEFQRLGSSLIIIAFDPGLFDERRSGRVELRLRTAHPNLALEQIRARMG